MAQQWDLDDDGQFDDAAGASASRSFTVGVKVVRLRVIDAAGAQAVHTRTVIVAPRPITTRIAQPVPGRALRRPPHAHGGPDPTASRCPRRRARRSSSAATSPPARCAACRTIAQRTGRAIRFRRFERRLRAGVVLSVSVTREGSIGKYTRFAIRRGKPPETPGPVPGSRSQEAVRVPGLMIARRTLLTVALGVALFAASYGVGRAGEGGTSEPTPAALPAIGRPGARQAAARSGGARHARGRRPSPPHRS